MSRPDSPSWGCLGVLLRFVGRLAALLPCLLPSLFVSFSLVPVAPAMAASLYPGEQYRGLAGDRRAYQPGDVLTVQIIESSSAQSAANTTTEKSGSLRLGWRSTSSERDASLSLSDQFNGRGQIQRSGRLLAQITVVVREVDPLTGLLLVAGQQQIMVNEEKQDIRLEGKVRPVDISDGNVVASTRLADARISYLGEGVLGEKQRPGLLTRILSWLGIL